MLINLEELREIIYKIADSIEENWQYLTDLDAAIGDGDHGINMNKGFKEVKKKLSALEIKDAAEVFKITGMALVSTVGGASGPLYGTAFMKAAATSTGKVQLGLNDLADILKAFVEGIKLRGRAEIGDKTMLDVIIPVYELITEAAAKDMPSKEALEKATLLALERVEYTKTIPARKGRASYLGDRSIGHQDPGATSSYLMVKAVYDYITEREG